MTGLDPAISHGTTPGCMPRLDRRLQQRPLALIESDLDQRLRSNRTLTLRIGCARASKLTI
jgi:hypothetical protein